MKRFRTILTVFLFITAIVCNAQLSKTEVDNMVLNNIVNDTTKFVYVFNEMLSRGESVMTADGVELRNPYENAYVYFIDDIPAANWAHPCRYIFINVTDGSYITENGTIYPYDYKSFVRIGEQTVGNRWQWPYTNYTIPSKAAPNSKLYAVLITGLPNGSLLKGWYNLSCVYTALVNKYGFMEPTPNTSHSHIYVCAHTSIIDIMSLAGPYNTGEWVQFDLNHSGAWYNQLDFNHTYQRKADIKEVFDNLSGLSNSLDDVPELDEDDQLFIMLCGVGYKNTQHSMILLEGGTDAEYLLDSDLANWVSDIKCSQMTFLIDCNFSGGFIDNLMDVSAASCKNRAVHTSTDATHYSWNEKHITRDKYRGNGGDDSKDKVDEYIYYWSAASLGYYPILEIYQDSISGPWYKYSNTAIGQFPWEEFDSFGDPTGALHAPYDVNPDSNTDAVLTMEEAFRFADNLDSYSRRGYFNPITLMQGGDSCVEYPCHAYESSFTKELLSLNGYHGTISNNAETGVGHKYLLEGPVDLEANDTLTINNNFIIEGNHKNFYNHGTFVTAPNTNNATFKRLNIRNAQGELSLSNCVFDTCGVIITYDTPFSITNSVFNQTRIKADNNLPRNSYSVVLTGNDFNSTTANATIELVNIMQCNVSDNDITSGGDGIYIKELSGLYTNYVFNDNIIHNCGGNGFVSYNSNSTLNGNIIHYNTLDGLQSFNISNVYAIGNDTAPSKYDTQRFAYNGRYQVHATNNSYPQNFHYNWLAESYNSAYKILYYESNYAPNQRPLVFNVTNNCWEPLYDNQIPSHLLSTGNTVFNYLPTWHPTGSVNMPNDAEAILALGNSYAENGNYNAAKDAYMELVSNYPESVEAIAALKSLLIIEDVSGGNFIDLKEYFTGLSSDLNLGYAADNLSNRCNVMMGNYDDAIEWYENKIDDPDASYAERVFAEIDLGDLYLRINDLDNRNAHGRLTQYIPTSKDEHETRTKYLLSTLPFDAEKNVTSNLSAINDAGSIILTCAPCPADHQMNVSYTLGDETDVELSIYGLFGNKVLQVCLGKQNAGIHNYDLNVSDIHDGLYFCEINCGDNKKEIMKTIIKH